MKASLVKAMVLLSRTAASAGLLGPEFCASTYRAPVNDLKGPGWRVLSLYSPNGTRLVERTTTNLWDSCRCELDQLCYCCAFDIERACAEIHRRNTTTMDVFHLPPCERGRQ
jgi:hypothetical protein